MEISFGSITSGQLDWSQDSVSNEEAPSWSEIRCSAFEGRKLHTSVVVKDCIVIIGGANIQDRPLEDIIIFDIKNLEWISYDIPMVSLHARKGHTACVYGDNKIVVFGGKNDRLLRDTLMITIEEKSSDEARFSIKCEELETQNSEDLYKIFHTANIYQNQMYVFGGWNEFRESTNELWKLDLNGLAWSLCPSTGNKPGEREGHCSILYNHRLFIFGGYSTQDRSRKNDLFVLDLVSFDWQKVKTTYLWPDLRSSSCAQEKDGEIYFFGGYVEHGYSNDMFKYNIENNTWIQLDNKTSKITPRADHTFVQYEDNFFVIGGWNGIKCLSEMHCLHLNNQGRNSYKETERREKAKLLLNKRYSDVCFKVQDQEFPCHRCILAIKCNFFANMFESEMRESQASCIEINDVKPEVFKSLLEFIYIDKVNLSEELALDLLELADKYSFEELKVICERFLSANITTSNLFMLANKAEFFSCQKLKNAVFEFGIKNLDSLQETNELEKFSKPFLLKIISKITNKK